jgi:hypothetical protein
MVRPAHGPLRRDVVSRARGARGAHLMRAPARLPAAQAEGRLSTRRIILSS